MRVALSLYILIFQVVSFLPGDTVSDINVGWKKKNMLFFFQYLVIWRSKQGLQARTSMFLRVRNAYLINGYKVEHVLENLILGLFRGDRPKPLQTCPKRLKMGSGSGLGKLGEKLNFQLLYFWVMVDGLDSGMSRIDVQIYIGVHF